MDTTSKKTIIIGAGTVEIDAEAPSTSGSFKEFLLNNKGNKVLLWLAAIAILLQFIVFKYLYITPGFIDGDSYVYLETAFYNLNINTYPIGYSKFLRFFSTVTQSDIILVGFQYLLLQCSSLFFIFTLAWLYKPGKGVFTLLFCCIVFNPVFLYMSNYVSSDALFLGLSLIWFALLLWIIHRPSHRLVIIHAIIILLAFTVRYNALFYPIVGAIAFLLSRQPLRMKIVGIVASMLLIAGFMYHTSNQYNQLTGIRQFSPFSGWQMANNALYAYRFVQDKKSTHLPTRFKQLDKMVRTYFDTTRNVNVHTQEMAIASTWYMWDPKSPLQIYMNRQFKKDSTAPSLKRWATVGPLYADYGAYLIRQYPQAFTQYYLLPNMLKYYTPPVEFLDTYNMGKDSIAPMGQIWFGLKNGKVKTYFKDLKVTVLNFYPVLVGVLNVIFLVGLIGFVLLNGFRYQKLLSCGLLLVFGLWVVNFGFSVFASQIALRFQMLPVLVFMAFAFLLIEYAWKEAFATDKHDTNKKKIMRNILVVLMLGSTLSCNEKATNNVKHDKGKSLPAFNVLMMDSTTKFNIGKISNGKPTVLFFFSPDCPYCQGLSKDIIAHIGKFKNDQIFFLSSAPFNDIKKYNDLLKLDKYPNITIGQDYTGFFFSYFKGTSIPYLVIYDRKKKYKQTVIGNVNADSVVNVING